MSFRFNRQTRFNANIRNEEQKKKRKKCGTRRWKKREGGGKSIDRKWKKKRIDRNFAYEITEAFEITKTDWVKEKKLMMKQPNWRQRRRIIQKRRNENRWIFSSDVENSTKKMFHKKKNIFPRSIVRVEMSMIVLHRNDFDNCHNHWRWNANPSAITNYKSVIKNSVKTRYNESARVFQKRLGVTRVGWGKKNNRNNFEK